MELTSLLALCSVGYEVSTILLFYTLIFVDFDVDVFGIYKYISDQKLLDYFNLIILAIIIIAITTNIEELNNLEKKREREKEKEREREREEKGINQF